MADVHGRVVGNTRVTSCSHAWNAIEFEAFAPGSGPMAVRRSLGRTVRVRLSSQNPSIVDIVTMASHSLTPSAPRGTWLITGPKIPIFPSGLSKAMDRSADVLADEFKTLVHLLANDRVPGLVLERRGVRCVEACLFEENFRARVETIIMVEWPVRTPNRRRMRRRCRQRPSPTRTRAAVCGYRASEGSTRSLPAGCS